MRTAAPGMLFGSANAGNAKYAAIYIGHPISLTAVEASTEEEAFWPFGPTDEPVDTSVLIGFFGGVRGEEADDLLPMIEEEPTKQLGFREHIVGELTAITRALTVVAILHYLWISFGSSLLYPNGQEHLWTARSLWGHRQYGRRLDSHDRSHRKAVDRLLQQRLR